MTTIPKFQSPVAIIANGSVGNPDKLRDKLKPFPSIIAADGGLLNCQKAGISPDFIIGDIDSTPADILDQYREVPIKIFPTDKDHTDLELAIEEAVKQNISEIVVFCALEMRTDHALYNLHLLNRYPKILRIESDYETLFSIEGKNTLNCRPGQILSLIPVGVPAKGITTTGLKWELKNAAFNQQKMSLSNICLSDTISIEISEGSLICCLIK